MFVTSASLPGASVPYVLRAGQGMTHLVGGQVVRTIARDLETAGSFGIVVCVSPRDPQPIPLHWHAREHDTWYCTRGRLQVWSGDESRMLFPGDFASVVPRDVHSYQCQGEHTEFFGVVGPGGWEAFFADAGEPWHEAMFPPAGSHPIDFARMGQAMHKHGVNRADAQVFAPPSSGDADVSLPGAPRSFFLQAGHGTRYLWLHHLCTSLLTSAETDGLFQMRVIETGAGAHLPPHRQTHTHEFIYLQDGKLDLTLDGTHHHLIAGESANIPAGCIKSTRSGSVDTRWISVTAGGEAARLFTVAGAPTAAFTYPLGAPAACDFAAARSASAAIGADFLE